MATTITLTPTSTILLLFTLNGLFYLSFCSDHSPLSPKAIDVEHPAIDLTPSPIHLSSQGPKDVTFCERVSINGISRIKLQNYAKAYKVMVVPSVVIPDKLHNKIQICFHQNASLGLCQCEKDDWRFIRKGYWSSIMSPFDQKFVDVKFVGGVSGSVTVTLDEVLQGWRYILLAVGFSLLFLAPIVSTWVPFYYTSSMAIGIFAVVLIILYQGMKLLPTGRKSAFYLSIYSTLLGAGSFLVHYVVEFVNSILVNFGLSQELQSPVSVFMLVAIILLGAGLGYWLVRTYVISEDGDVDIGIAQFIKWAMRVISVTSIYLSSIDTPLAILSVGFSISLYYIITSINWENHQVPLTFKKSKLWERSGQRTSLAEFLKRPKKISQWHNGPMNSFASPNKGMVNISGGSRSNESQHDFYSTFHKTPNRKKFSKREWEEFTEESTRESVADLASSPEFTDWVIRNANRIKVGPDNGSDNEVSGSDSTDGYLVKNANKRHFFNWRR